MLHVLLLVVGLNPGGLEARVQGPPPPPPMMRDAAPGEQKTGKGVIRGRVTNADGRPLRRARVSVSGPDVGGAKSASTNTQGRFEIRDLPAGRFSVVVTRSGYIGQTFGQRRPGDAGRPVELAEAQVIENVDFALQRMSVITGRVIDELGDPVSDATVYSMQLRYFQGRRQLVPVGTLGIRTDDAGQYRLLGLPPGDYYVLASLRESWPLETDPTQVFGYIPTYHPAAVNVAEAQRIRVALGQEVSAIDVQLVPGRTAKVSGVAMSSSGVPVAGETVSLSLEVRGPTMMSTMSVASAKTAGDGTFTLTNVPAGDYRLSVRATGPAPQEQGDLMVSVAGSDLEGVTVVTGAGGTFRGTVVREDGATLSPPLDRLVVRAQPIAGPSRVGTQTAENGRVARDGTFETRGALGPTLLSVSPLSGGWVVKSIEHDGRDVADAPFDVQHDDAIVGLRIVLTDKPSAVRGMLRDERTRAVADGTVLVFPADESKWIEGTRAIRTARPDQTGQFSIRGLPPGDYLAIALEYVEDGQQHDPEFLEGIRMKAERFTLAEAETKGLDLTVRK